MFERYSQPLASFPVFVKRLAINFFIGLFLIFIVVSIGMWGYHYIGKLPWTDSFLNASMILSGMGPVDTLPNNTAKIFAGIYALFSGLVFILVIAVLFAPLLHRFFHHFHVSSE